MLSMRNCRPSDLVVTGVGITSAIGQGKRAFTDGLMEGRHAFGVMQRPGRQKDTAFLGAEIGELEYPAAFPKRMLRTASFTAQVAAVTLQEAWTDARLDQADPCRIGLVVGGSNLQQREQLLLYEAYAGKLPFLRPTYGMSFMDTDICGLCTEWFGIRGPAVTAGGASASGQVAVIQAAQAVLSGQVDICIALGALMDLSYMECQALTALGAMGSERYAGEPALACRPFDALRDGFIYGEGCGAVVIERADADRRPDVKPYASLAGWAICMDANRNPNPSCDGEVMAITRALEHAGLSAGDIDYVNPHGTGSAVGDETELKAFRTAGLGHAFVNATKSVTGHGLSAAGAVEVIATLLQMREGRLHPTRNLDQPMDEGFRWVRNVPVNHQIRRAVNMSLGFGGINTAVVIEKYD